MHSSQTQVPSPASLGPQLSEHRGKFSAGGWSWYLGGMAMLACAFGLGKAIKLTLAGETLAPDLVWTALAAGGAGILLLIVPMLRWRQKVICYANGIVWHRLLGDKTIQRQQLSAVSLIHHRGRHTNHDEVELSTTNGTVSIVGIDHPEQLTNHVLAWLRGSAFAQVIAAGSDQQTGGGWTPPV